MRIQLWCWNYAPEPTAMGPVATVWARAMRERGHLVDVVSAFPHYPPSVGEQRVLPYRELRDGIPVLRLPLLIGHATPTRRILEESTYAASVALASGFVRRPDVAVVVSPSFLALAPILASARIRRVPWVLWLQDILPDAASTTGLLRNPLLLRGASWLEHVAYRAADRIVVISDAFAENLSRKGVPASAIERIYNPTTRPFARSAGVPTRPLRLLSMGNIGHSQGLVELVEAVERSDLAGSEFRLVVIGEGERSTELRLAITSDRVEYLGLVDDVRLGEELARADVGLVSQRPGIDEFNLPSKLMTFMASAVPVLAVTPSRSEVARLVRDSGGGWVVDYDSPRHLLRALGEVLADPAEIQSRGRAALEFAYCHFAPHVVAENFENVLLAVSDPRRDRAPRDAGQHEPLRPYRR